MGDWEMEVTVEEIAADVECVVCGDAGLMFNFNGETVCAECYIALREIEKGE